MAGRRGSEEDALNSDRASDEMALIDGGGNWESAFSGCPNLEKVIFPDKKYYSESNSIAPNAFDGCSEKLVFSVPEKRTRLIGWLERHGFRVEIRKEN